MHTLSLEEICQGVFLFTIDNHSKNKLNASMRHVVAIFQTCLMLVGLPCLANQSYLPPNLPLSNPTYQVAENIPQAEPLTGDNIPLAEPITSQGESIPLAQPLPDSTPTIPGIPNFSMPFFSQALVPQNETRVAILGYHDFSSTKPATEMRIPTSHFRAQMQALKNSGIAVISMKDFLEWKNGEKKLPAQCVLITIDDGWLSVYTDAFPVLAEMNFPFTIFPYTQFMTGRGTAMGINQYKDMINYGVTVGSHSVSHLYPKSWRTAKRQGPEALDKLIQKEIGDSRTILSNHFPNISINTYCYPGGFVLPEMTEKLEALGYEAAFTVIPKKVTKDTDRWQIHRYMVYGKDPKTFNRAVTFNESGAAPSLPTQPQRAGHQPAINNPPPLQAVQPLANSTSPDMTPIIAISMAKETDFDPSSLMMRISGFGKVQAQYDEQNKNFAWKSNRPLVTNPVTVQVRWKTLSSGTWRSASWQFNTKETTSTLVPKNIVK